MRRHGRLWYCPTCNRDADPYGVGIVEHYGEMRSAWCGHTLLANGTLYEACARLENAVRDLGREMFGACTPMVEWLSRRRTMQRLAERVTR